MMENNEQNDSQIYELGYHLVPTLDESEVSETFSKVKEVFTKAGVNIISEQVPEMRSLAYEMTKSVDSKNLRFTKAYFGWIKFEADTMQVQTLRESVANVPEILRSLLVKTVKENTMHFQKIHAKKDESTTEERGEVVAAPIKEALEQDIDKSIDALVA